MSGISDSLLRLIAAMTKQEKRYFKLYATFYNKEEGNSCLRLFELIEQNRPAGNRELTAIVEQTSYARQLPFLKNQLTEQILDSLSAYHSSKKSWLALQRLLAHADVLMDKGLHDHARRLVARAEKKALALQEHVWVLEVLQRKRALAIRRITPDFEDNIQELYAHVRETLELLFSTTRYRELMDIMQVLAARYATTPTRRDGEKLREIASQALLEDGSGATSFHARLALYNVLGTYALLTGNSADARDHYRSAIHLWQQHPVMVREHEAQYQNYLVNYLNCLIDGGDEAEFATVMREAKKLYASGEETPAQATDLWNIEFLFYINRGSLPGCRQAVHAMEHRLAIDTDPLDPPMFITLCHNCSMYYFLTENYARSLTYIHAIQSETRIELKRDLQILSRLFSLVIHYELGNIDILDNLIRSARRYLKKNDASDALTRLVIRSIAALPGATDVAERQRIYRTLRTDLGRLLHDNPGREIVGLPELLFWTESKLYMRPLPDLFTEKMARRETPQDMFPVEAESGSV